MTEAFTQALAALDRGDLGALHTAVRDHPDVLTERVEEEDDTYGGYFHGATLLQHAAGNPYRGVLPDNMVEIARFLIDAGADHHATCGGGPKQPDTAGGNLLGLVASSGHAAMRGLAKPLIDLLIEKGATFGDDAGVLFSALYHTVECKLQRDVGRYLYERGANADVVFAAALGERELVDSMFNADGSLTPQGRGQWRGDYDTRSARSDQQIIQEALLWACMNGQSAMIDPLLTRGATINGLASVSRWQITPLHGAAWGGWPETCAWLLERGADHSIVDAVEQATPIGWATYCKRTDVMELFRLRCYSSLTLADAMEIGDEHQVAMALDQIDDVDAPPPGIEAGRGVLLRVAAYSGREEVVKLLLDRGADPAQTNRDGVSARDIAAKQGHDSIVEMLS